MAKTIGIVFVLCLSTRAELSPRPNQKIRPGRHQLVSQSRDDLLAAVGVTNIDRVIAPFNPLQLAHAGAKRGEEKLGGDGSFAVEREPSDSSHARGLLSV